MQMSGPSKELAYRWVVTFLSNPVYFPPSTSTSVETDESADILVETDGDKRIG